MRGMSIFLRKIDSTVAVPVYTIWENAIKPIDSIALIGTTEVVPCYKTFLAGFFIKLPWDISRARLRKL